MEGGRWGYRQSHHFGCYDGITNHMCHEVIITSYVLTTHVEGGRREHRQSYHYGCYDGITNHLSHEIIIT